MDNKDLKVIGIIALIGIAVFAVNKFNKPPALPTEARVITQGVITADPLFERMAPFLEQFHSCLKSEKPNSDCEQFLAVDDDVFKDRANLIAALPQVRAAIRQVTQMEITNIVGKQLFSSTPDRHEVPVYDIDGEFEYKTSSTKFHYTVVIQNNEMKINRFLIDSAP